MKRIIAAFLIFLLIISADANFVNKSSNNYPLPFSKKEINEGVITYNLEYIGDPNEIPIISLLPTEMTIKFNKNHSIKTVEGWMGIFMFGGIVNAKESSKTALLEIMGKKYFNTSDIGENRTFGYNPMNGKRIQYTNKTKRIAGYKCKKAIISWGIEIFDVYYTDKIKINGVNWNNPYPEIDGVLLEYQTDIFGVKTICTASNVEEISIDSTEFAIPELYIESSCEKMDSIIKNLM